MRYNIAQVMEQFGKDHFFDLFTEKIKIMLQSPQEYLKVISDIMDPLFTNEQSRQTLIDTGVIEEWIRYVFRHADSDNRNPKTSRIVA